MNDDVSSVLDRLHNNINLVENNIYTSKTLKEIESDYFCLLELIKLFLIGRRDTYYGYFLMNLTFKCDFKGQHLAGIELNTYPPVFSANPLLLCCLSLKEIIFVVCHELDHLLFNHPALMVKANPSKNPEIFKRFNLAADASINDTLQYGTFLDQLLKKKPDNDYIQAPKGIIFSKTLSEIYDIKQKLLKSQNYLYYFNLLMEIPLSGGESKNDENESDNKESVSDKMQTNKGEARDDGLVTRNSPLPYEDHSWSNEDTSADDMESVTREFLLDVDNTMSDETKGTMPPCYQDTIEIIKNPPQIAWQSILKKYIGSIVANKTKTRMKLNRRQPERYDLSGVKDDKVIKIAVAIDASGSLDQKMLGKILNEIFDIVSKRHAEITILECDDAVRKVYKVRNPYEVQNKIIGRGGTAFTPVIQYLNNDKYYRDSLLIYFTDGYGEDSIPKPLTYRNIWVIVGGKKNDLSVKEPYGMVLEMK